MDNIDNYLTYINEEEELEEIGLVTTGLFAAPLIIKGANFAFKNIFNKAHRTCRKLSKEDYAICVRKIKLKAFKAQLTKLKAGLAKCSKDKKPEKCKQQLKTKISNAQLRLKVTQNALKRSIAKQRGK
ncbi:MAG: hypothetical protein PVG65_06200 [Candidatus Thorarchaeota archaeon]|jgi:hypothetical protein